MLWFSKIETNHKKAQQNFFAMWIFYKISLYEKHL